MKSELAPGLCADWLNGWLAAVGVTVLCPDVQLSWSGDPIPLAVFHHPADVPLAQRIANALPDEAALQGLVLASLPRNVELPRFSAAADESRSLGDPSLAFSISDLASGKRFNPGDLPHGGFDPPAPRGTTLASRAIGCRRLLEPEPAQRIDETLAGRAARKKANGLGFDIRRIPSGVQPEADVMVDPAIECLCFAALKLFPVRGDGRRTVQRGWNTRRSPTERGAFTWPVWSKLLDVWGIDAMLDGFHDASPKRAQSLGIEGAFASVPFQPTGSSDVTRGYGSERIA